MAAQVAVVERNARLIEESRRVTVSQRQLIEISDKIRSSVEMQTIIKTTADELAAALNAFNEEVTYKASFLSVLEGPVGARQALYMVAVYFGILLFYGVPYGVVGVLLATFLGWIVARSMQETRGFFWAWFIHFWQDVWIFSFLALGSILAGGG